MTVYALGLLSSDILHLYYTYTFIIFKTYIFSLYKHKAKHFLEKKSKDVRVPIKINKFIFKKRCRSKPFTTFAEKAVHIATRQLLREDRVPDSLLLFGPQFP